MKPLIDEASAAGLYPSHAKLPRQEPPAAESTATEPSGPRYTAARDYAPFMRESLESATAHLQLDDDAAANYPEATASLFREMGIPPGEAGPLHDVLVAGFKEPATPAQVRDWAGTAERDGRYGFGLKDYQRRVGLVQEYLDRRPLLRDLLAATGTGSHPKLVHALLVRADALPRRED